MTKIIWGSIGLNTIRLLVFIVAYFVLNEGKNVDYQEKGWTIILVGIGLFIILLAAAPLYFGQSNFTLIFSGFFAALPLVVAFGIILSKTPALRKCKATYADTYYTDKAQHHIAVAIEQGDTARLNEAIAGQDLTMKSNMVWDEAGLNYLQFAIRVRSNPIDFPFDEEKNKAVIRSLITEGVPTTPALAEATKYLPVEMIKLLLGRRSRSGCLWISK